jgi:asparagine synthase (glutamine-hydrolysing)
VCGIVAEFSLINRKPNMGLIRKMAHDIHHRGPDDEGYYEGDWYALGFKRLAILDLSRYGHQPMFDESNSFVITFNGEIYNYKEIRSQLISLGYVFFSNSDTEVVLKSYIEWGEACLQKFVGMFALIICNIKTGEVFIARDQLGIKPLYLFKDKNCILFSSEIKVFRHYTNFELNTGSLFEQFTYRYISGVNTIFKNVQRVLPGTFLKLNRNGEIKVQEYYDVLLNLEKSKRSNINFKEVEYRLNESIWAHTQSDVGYNIQLSGGLDSSYITAVLANRYKQKLNTYSVELDGFDKDESKFQKIVVDKFNTVHHGHSLTGKDYADNLVKATWHMDMPVVHGGVFLMMLCKYSQQNSKVILTGEGADELFGGYSRYNISRKIQFVYWMKKNGFNHHHLPSFWKFKSLKSLLNMDWGIREQVYHNNEKMMSLFNKLNTAIDYRRKNASRFNDYILKIIASDQTSYLQSLLERQDKFAMAMSVETRVPFCTYPLFEYINNFDYKAKIKPVPKMILKRISEKYFDHNFVYRKKIGFLLPYRKWLEDNSQTGRFLDLLTDDTFKARSFYNHKEINKLIGEHYNNKFDHSKYLMNLINFEIWHRLFIDRTINV